MICKVVLVLFLVTSKLVACTGLMLTAEDQTSVSGRTIEFGQNLDMSVAVIPRNFTFTATTPKGDGLVYTSKYGAVGGTCFESQILMDGMNEKGLVVGSFYFPGFAKYTPTTANNQKKSLSPIDFPNWILTQFANLEEVRAGVENVVIAPTILKDWGQAPAPMHYIVYDANGKSIVIEPLDGTLVVSDNPIGVFTNSPTFDWHLTNLRNFINLSPYNVAPIDLGNLKLAAFGQGSGMVGLPGDFTPASRFVRSAIFSAAAIASKSSSAAVDQAFHILNQFDIPVGVVRQKEQSETSYDYTLMTTVKDPQSLKYYYRSYGNQAIEFVDLTQFDLDAKQIKSLKIVGKQKSFDASHLLH